MTDAAAEPQKAKPTVGFTAIAIIAIAAYVWGTSHRESADPVLEKGREAVLLHYINHSGWYPIRCNEGRYEGLDTLYCHASGEPSIGGLHIIAQSGGEPVVFPINGTAMGKMRQSTIEAVDTSRVQVHEWNGPLIDIRRAIDATL